MALLPHMPHPSINEISGSPTQSKVWLLPKRGGQGNRTRWNRFLIKESQDALPNQCSSFGVSNAVSKSLPVSGAETALSHPKHKESKLPPSQSYFYCWGFSEPNILLGVSQKPWRMQPASPPITTLGNHGCFYCLHSHAFSRMSCSWDHTVCRLLTLASFTWQ